MGVTQFTIGATLAVGAVGQDMPTAPAEPLPGQSATIVVTGERARALGS